MAKDKRCVLVVEDDLDATEIMGEILESLGYTCRIARSGSEAIAMAGELRPDIVMLDIALPDVSGFEVARRLREAPGGGAVWIMALTGYSDAAHRDRAFASGFDRYLVKPITISTLERAMNEPAPARATQAARSVPAPQAL